MAVRCLDLTSGLVGAATVRLLLDTGVEVHRVPQESDEHFERRIPGYRYLRDGVRLLSADALASSVREMDLVLVGGEPSPRHGTTKPDTAWTEANPSLIVVDLGRTLSDGVTPAVEGLAQAATGMATEHLSSRPFWFGVPLASFGQAILSAYAAWAALVQRRRTGRAAPVRTWLDRGAGFFMGAFWMSAERPDAEFDKITPKDVKHLIFRCKDGGYIQFVMGVPRAVAKLYDVLEISAYADPDDRGFPKPGAPPERFFGDRALIEAHTLKLDRRIILDRARVVGLPAAPVLSVGEVWDHPQARANRLTRARGRDVVLTGFVSITTVGETDRPEPALSARGGPLSGYRVLDFGAFVAGPLIGRLLEDMGADVIKVEPLGGDPGRGTMRHFLVSQAGKRSLAVDIKTEDGERILRRLLEQADVLVHNFRGGVDDRLGLSPRKVHAVNPNIIAVASRAFGDAGPLADEPGFDMIAQALVGLERAAGGDAVEPAWYRTPYVDYAAGGLGAAAALSAVYRRGEDGDVCSCAVSLFNAGLFMVSDARRTSSGEVEEPARTTADQLGLSAWERHYRTSDGYITVTATDEPMASRLVETLLAGSPNARDDRAIQAELAEAFAARSTRHWVESLARAEVWATPIAAPAIPRAERSDDTYGRIRGHLHAFADVGQSHSLATRPGAPALGLHSREVLVEHGFTMTEIDDFIRAGSVRAGHVPEDG